MTTVPIHVVHAGAANAGGGAHTGQCFEYHGQFMTISGGIRCTSILWLRLPGADAAAAPAVDVPPPSAAAAAALHAAAPALAAPAAALSAEARAEALGAALPGQHSADRAGARAPSLACTTADFDFIRLVPPKECAAHHALETLLANAAAGDGHDDDNGVPSANVADDDRVAGDNDDDVVVENDKGKPANQGRSRSGSNDNRGGGGSCGGNCGGSRSSSSSSSRGIKDVCAPLSPPVAADVLQTYFRWFAERTGLPPPPGTIDAPVDADTDENAESGSLGVRPGKRRKTEGNSEAVNAAADISLVADGNSVTAASGVGGAGREGCQFGNAARASADAGAETAAAASSAEEAAPPSSASHQADSRPPLRKKPNVKAKHGRGSGSASASRLNMFNWRHCERLDHATTMDDGSVRLELGVNGCTIVALRAHPRVAIALLAAQAACVGDGAASKAIRLPERVSGSPAAAVAAARCASISMVTDAEDDHADWPIVEAVALRVARGKEGPVPPLLPPPRPVAAGEPMLGSRSGTCATAPASAAGEVKECSASGSADDPSAVRHALSHDRVQRLEQQRHPQQHWRHEPLSVRLQNAAAGVPFWLLVKPEFATATDGGLFISNTGLIAAPVVPAVRPATGADMAAAITDVRSADELHAQVLRGLAALEQAATTARRQEVSVLHS